MFTHVREKGHALAKGGGGTPGDDDEESDGPVRGKGKKGGKKGKR